jgi:hypothetical protein
MCIRVHEEATGIIKKPYLLHYAGTQSNSRWIPICGCLNS